MKTENLRYSIQPQHSNSQKHSARRMQAKGYNDLNNITAKSVNECDKIELNKSVKKATAGIKPSGRLSFKANPAPIARTIGEKLAVNKGFNKFLDILADNSLIADALIALGLTTVARPASIYIIPTKDPVEKRKNNYQVGHSIATGLLGLGTTIAVAEPVKRGVKKVLNNPEKYMKTDTSYVRNNSRVFKETAGRLHQPIFLPLRAMLTIAIVRPILEAMGLSKHGKPLDEASKTKIDYSFLSFKGDDSKSFKGFAKVKSSYDKATDKVLASNAHNPSFKGLGGAVTEGIAKGIGKIADTNAFRKFIEWFKEKNQWFPHLIAAESLWLSGFYMQQTAKSKSIEKDQKLPMILNQGITAILCTWGAYKLDGVVNKALDGYKETYKRMNPDMVRKANIYSYLTKRYANNPEKLKALTNGEAAKEIREASKRLNTKLIGIRLLGPIVIFTTIYRFIGPVVVTPIANKISELIEPHKKQA